MIKGATVLAIIGVAKSIVGSRYIDLVFIDPEYRIALTHDWITLVSADVKTSDIDACIERAQLGHGCVSTTMGKPDGRICVATKEWLKDHDFTHAGLCKLEIE